MKKLFLVSAISFLLLSGFNQGIVLADNYYVDAGSGTDEPSYGGSPGNGSWKTITYALSQVSGSSGSPATIHVAAGTYNPALGEVFPLNMEDYVSLHGEGQKITIIDAGGTWEFRRRVITSDSANGYSIAGFTITGGWRGSGSDEGGGMYCNNSSPTITNCTFSGNIADWKGGGIANNNSSPTITNCIFSGNDAYQGGGIYNWDSSPTITNCVFSDNGRGWENDGCGMYNYNSSPIIINCIFSGNGGVSQFSSKNSTSEFLSGISFGGGIYNEGGAPIIINCIFLRNHTAYTHGGGIYNISSSSSIINCTFSGNRAGWRGGGIYTDSSATITNCILWGNSAGDGPEIIDYGASVSYSNINQDGYEGINGNIRQDPLFLNITDPDPLSWNLHLQSGSPCIDTGDNTAVPADTTDLDGDGDTAEQLPFDLDGTLRFADDVMTPDTGNGTSPIVDMGAYEYFDADGDGIPNDADNCPTTPNGPDGGTCSAGTTGAPCMTHGDCGCQGECSIDQEDVDEDGVGDVCDDSPLDYDNDGICDPGESDPTCSGSDNCPEVPNGPAKGSCFNYFTHAVWGECLDNSSCRVNNEGWIWCDTINNDMDGDGTGDVCKDCSLDSRFEKTTLAEGIKYYTDRDYVLNWFDFKYLGLTTIKTPNDEKNATDARDYLTFNMPSDGTVYVGYDPRATSLPDWMSGFTDTGDDIGISDTDQGYFNVYRRHYSAEECINLGGNKALGFSGGEVSNYIVFY